MHRYLIAGILASLAMSACGDLATVPERVPTSILLNHDVLTTTRGDAVDLQVTVLDQRGDPIENVPTWANVSWRSSDGSIVALRNDGLNAVGSGQTTVTASVAGMERSATVRVNPSSLKLDIASIRLIQANQTSGFLVPGVETTIQVFVIGDVVNFFQPKVKATLLRNDQVVATYLMERAASSIPLQLNTHEPAGAWTATVPAELVQPGLQLVVDADPEGSIPRSAGSIDRYPEGGAFFLAVGESAVQLEVAGAYLTQSIQRFDGSIPLVQGRPAFLRVFLTADEDNPHRPIVRATFLRDGAVVHQVDMTSDNLSIPTSTQEGLLSRSWNATIPGGVIQSGLTLVIEADPDHLIPMKTGSATRLPATGSMFLDIRAVPPLWLRMVPITQSTIGTTGNITNANLASYVHAAVSKFPLAQVDVDFRTPYITTSAATSYNGWLQILNEIRTLRTTDVSGRYYYGVLTHPGGNQIGGLGYIGFPAAVGYDSPQRGAETFAHELGHNFSLRHAPCGGPTDADPQFPYTGGSIGVFGYDLSTGTLKTPSADRDLMSYCGPEWISDFSYLKALNYRQSFDWSGTGPSVVQDALLVWGGSIDGQLILEPSFRLDMLPSMPSGQGSYEVRGFDDAGAQLFGFRFEPEEVDHLGAKGFSFAIPERFAQADRLAEIVLSGPEGEVSRRRAEVAPTPAGRSNRPGVITTEMSWDATRSPMALVRDPQTGEVISFARGGRVSLPGRLLEVHLSDGVRSTRRLLDLR